MAGIDRCFLVLELSTRSAALSQRNASRKRLGFVLNLQRLVLYDSYWLLLFVVEGKRRYQVG